MAKKEKVIYPSIVEIESFLDNWKLEAKKFYLNLFDRFLEEQSREYEITEENLKSIIDWYGKREFSDEKIKNILSDLEKGTLYYRLDQLQSKISYCKFRKWKEGLTKQAINLCEKFAHERYRNGLDDFLTKEVDSKRENLFDAVYKKVGMIEKVQFIKTGSDGELNGTFIGTDGKVNVNTIYAGGYNIQCLHFRFLVKKIK